MAKKQRRNKLGRPPTIDARILKLLKQAIETPMPVTYACDIIKLSRTVFYETLERDAHFRTEIELSKAIAIRKLILLTAKQQGGWKLLKNMGKDEFQETIELAGNKDKPLEMVVRDLRIPKKEEK